MMDPVVEFGISGAFALLFAVAGVEKWNNRDMFLSRLARYEILPAWSIEAAGYAVIVTELLLASFLISPWHRDVVLPAMGLLLIYALAMGVNLARGRNYIDCGCLGAAGEGLNIWVVARNLVMIALLAALLVPAAERRLVWLDYLSVGFMIAGMSLCYATANTLIANHIRARTGWAAA